MVMSGGRGQKIWVKFEGSSGGRGRKTMSKTKNDVWQAMPKIIERDWDNERGQR